MALNPIDVLKAIEGYHQAEANSSSDRPIKLATIDPAYVASSFPATLPKVTFDGESTLSTKFYPAAYWPEPGDRVWMVPIGTTYLIAGTINDEKLGGRGTYVPALTAPTTNPNLGSGGGFTQLGWWYRSGNGMIDAYIRLRFGTTGVSAGTGFYTITLPTAVRDLPAAGGAAEGSIIGNGAIRAELPTPVKIRQVACQLLDGAAGTFRMLERDGNTGIVNHQFPWVWAVNDDITLQVRYPAV